MDPIHKWLPAKNKFVSTKINPTNLVFTLNEISWANLHAYKRILNWKPFMIRVYGANLIEKRTAMSDIFN